jgi:DNA polymerase IV
MERRIVCFNVPSFEITLARLCEPRLRRWPTAVAPVHYARSFVWEVSKEARQEGLYPGMPLNLARRMCARLRVIRPDPRRVALGHRLLQESIRQFSPIFELAHEGEFYADLTARTVLFREATAIGARIEKEISERYGISGVTGVATNKLVSGVAANLFEAATIYGVKPGDEASFLAPLPISSLPGIATLFAPRTNEVLQSFEELCLRLVRDVAWIPSEQLKLIIGGKTALLKQWSVGVDPSPVCPEGSQKGFAISQSLMTDEIDDHRLLPILYRLLEKLCDRLRKQNRLLISVTLMLSYSDGREFQKRQRLSAATDLESEIYPILQQLFFSINRRVRVRSLGLQFETARSPGAQLKLFAQRRVATSSDE